MDGHIHSIFLLQKRTAISGLPKRVRGEHDEKMYSKDFTSEESVAIAEALEPADRREARERITTNTTQPCRSFKENKRDMGRTGNAVSNFSIVA